MRTFLLSSPLVAAAIVLAGCGGSTDDTSSTAPASDDGGSTADADAGPDAPATTPEAGDAAPDAPYPAPHPPMAQMTDHGGKVLTAPVLVTITFAGDPLESFVQTFDDALGGLSWWNTTMGEYGVAPATSGGHVVIADAAPTTISDTEIQQWLGARIDDATLPAPTDQTIYVLYYPDTTTITLPGAQGTSCQGFGGYHSWFKKATRSPKPRPIRTPRCSPASRT
jgi:hypothetical protein